MVFKFINYALLQGFDTNVKDDVILRAVGFLNNDIVASLHLKNDTYEIESNFYSCGEQKNKS